MALTNLLRRVGAASPLVPALTYAGVLSVANTVTALVPGSLLIGVIGLLAWLTALLFLFVVVTWFRDDDWLSAGFLLGLTILVGGLAADVVARTVATHELADAVFSSPAAS